MGSQESKTELNIYYQNVNSMRNKFETFRNNFMNTEERYDAIVLTETNLQGSTPYVNFLESRGYSVFESQRNLGKEGSKLSGGGVLVAVLKEYNPVRRTIMETDVVNMESVAVSLTVNSRRMNLFGVYIPPRSNCGTYDAFYTSLIACNLLRPNDMYTIMGDFNIPEADCNSRICPGNDNSGDMHVSVKKFLVLMKLLQVSQYNNIGNVRNRLLDLVLSNQPITISRPRISLIPEEGNHPALVATVTLAQTVNEDSGFTDDEFNDYYRMLKRYFAGEKWNRMFRLRSVDEITEFLGGKLDNAFNDVKNTKVRNYLKLNASNKIKIFSEYLRSEDWSSESAFPYLTIVKGLTMGILGLGLSLFGGKK